MIHVFFGVNSLTKAKLWIAKKSREIDTISFSLLFLSVFLATNGSISANVRISMRILKLIILQHLGEDTMKSFRNTLFYLLMILLPFH